MESKTDQRQADRDAFEAAERRIAERRAAIEAAGGLTISVKPEVKRGEPALFEDATSPDCPDCRGRGFRMVDGDPLTMGRCPCQAPTYDGPESVPPDRLERYGCPAKLSGALRATWNPELGKWPTEADLWPRDLRDSEGKPPSVILFHGDVGTGKSRVAAWIMRRAMVAGRRCRWIDVPQLITASIRAIGDDDAQRNVETKISGWLRYELVVLDDIGKQQKTDYQVLSLFGDWVRRLDDGPGLIVGTTNLSPEQLEDFEPSIASRLMGGPVRQMEGADGRRKRWWRR